MRIRTIHALLTVPATLFAVVTLMGGHGERVARAGDSSAAKQVSKSKSKKKAKFTASIETASRGVVVPPHIDDIEQMCAMLLGCDGLPLQRPTDDFGLCVRHYAAQMSSPKELTSSLTIRECGLNSMTCRQFSHCAFRGAEPTGCAGRGMDGSGPVGRCDLGGRALTCLDGHVVGVRDCPRGGELCAIRHGKAACVSGKCKKDSPPVCSKDGYRIVSCQGGRKVSVNCRALGLVCQADDQGQPRCVPPKSKSCDKNTKPLCKGSDAVFCENGKEVKVKCGSAQLVCGLNVKDDLKIGACAFSPYDGKDGECNPKKFRTRCRGKFVEYCIAGRKRRYQCFSFTGLGKCVGRPGHAHCE